MRREWCEWGSIWRARQTVVSCMSSSCMSICMTTWPSSVLRDHWKSWKGLTSMLVDIDVIVTSPPKNAPLHGDHPSLPLCMWGWIWSTTSAYSTCASRERFMKKHQVHVIKVWRIQPTKHKTNISNWCFLGKPNKFLEWEWIIFGNSRTINHGHRASLQCWNSMIFVNVCKSAMCKTQLNCPLPVFHWQRSPG